MYSRILDQSVLSELIAAAPGAVKRPEEIARNILAIFEQEMEQPEIAEKIDIDGGCWFTGVSNLAEKIRLASPKTIGIVLRDMGLEKQHTRAGNIVFWNRRQAEILKRALAGVQNAG